MATYMDGGDGLPLCRECLDGECVSSQRCEDQVCRCGCQLDADRARQLDNRPPDKLASIARDMEAEARPTVAELLAERYGRPKRGAAWLLMQEGMEP